MTKDEFALRVPERMRARFVSKISFTSTCWLWTASVTGPKRGMYGQFAICVNGVVTISKAHRLAYGWAVGSIETGLVIDHLCRVHRCVNPAHLEPVTYRENCLRGASLQSQNAAKTHCKRGHPLSGANLAYRSDSGRECLTCKTLRNRRQLPVEVSR